MYQHHHGGYPGQPMPPGGGFAYQRQYYMVKCRLNGLVLDVEGGNPSPGARIITWSRKDGQHDNQLWYDDPQTGTIRSKLNDFCMDVRGDTIILNPFQPGNQGQSWERVNNVIRNRINGKHLDVANCNRDAGAHLVAWNYNGGANQHFDFEFVAGGPTAPPYGGYPQPPYPAYGQPPQPGFHPGVSRREFFIVSELNGKVVDICGGNASAGAEVIMFGKKMPPSKNQLWYLDNNGYIRSALNDLLFDAPAVDQVLRMTHYNGSHGQLWYFEGQKIVNRRGECLDIRGSDPNDLAKVIPFHFRGSANQKWRQEFV